MRRPALAVALGVSLLGWTAYLGFQPRRAVHADLSRGWFGDHFSHASACRAVLFAGFNVWKKPLNTLPHMTPQEGRALPDDAAGKMGGFWLPGRPHQKPLSAGWSEYPRPYPPGDLLAVLPVALLYELTDLSFALSNRLLIWLFVLYAHLGAYFLVRAGASREPLVVVGSILLYSESVHWALEGFYDVAALLPLGVVGLAVAERRWLTGLLAYAIAAFIHFRAYFFAPWALWMAWQLVRSRSWRAWGRREWVMVAFTALFSAGSLVSFWAVSSSLGSFPLQNPMSWATPWQARIGLVAFALAATAVFAWLRSWPDVAMTPWLFFMVASVRQAFGWHALLLLPWLFIRSPELDTPRTAVADGARLVLVLAFSALAYRNILLPSWLAQVP